ncbi:similar to Saccharomyces cerevisiae YER077C Putative protein of unknown function [Maudiozyma saulgeensis]|uniref:Mitochondrial group I intron splicing factor CCM1 n=1 Tax=Maudiozyma saulgeensis TaxID=1789683 RepID=A0A1X7R355_9SACH|nr:similar to Saccharomyces cerevisiae YER077C Putative protein of unknown function [Kazachstania saulgeensis]
MSLIRVKYVTTQQAYLFPQISRSIHGTSTNLGSNVKAKLDELRKHDVVLRKTSKDLSRLEKQRSVQTKKKLKTAYSKPIAYKKIKKYNLESDLVTTGSTPNLGPTSDDNLQVLAKTNDKRLIYTVLGITGEQLRDSVLVSNDVAKFIRRGQLEKAIFLAKLAKHKGAAAMNVIMKHYLEDLNSPRSALQIYNWRKKVDVPLNEYSNTILFSGLAKQKKPFSKTLGMSVYNIVDRLIIDNKLNQTEYNAALGALCNCVDVSYAFKLFQRKHLVKGIHYDAISMMWMVRTSSKVRTSSLFTEVFNELVSLINKNQVDDKLLFEICKTLHNKDKYNSSLLMAVNKYFEIPASDAWNNALKRTSSLSGDLKLPELEKWNIKRRFPLNKHIIGLLLKNSVKTRSYNLGVSLYEEVKESNANLIDIDIFHSYLNLVIESSSADCVDKLLEAIKEADQKNLNYISKHTITLGYMALKKGARKARFNTSPERVADLFQKCDSFVSHYDSKYSKDLQCNVYSRESWLYLFQIVRELNSKDGFILESKEFILEQYLKTVRAGEFDTKNLQSEDYSKEIYLQLEAVRLLSSIAEDLKIKNDDDLDITVMKDDNFLRRRLILRLKGRLLLHIKELENALQKGTKIEPTNSQWSIKQLATRIADKNYGGNEAVIYEERNSLNTKNN